MSATALFFFLAMPTSLLIERKEVDIMKSYYNGYSVVGWVPDKRGGRWRFFATETEYREAYNEAVISMWKSQPRR